jgi:hypothetical protein
MLYKGLNICEDAKKGLNICEVDKKGLNICEDEKKELNICEDEKKRTKRTSALLDHVCDLLPVFWHFEDVVDSI